MNSRYIDESAKRKLYAESMGRCMNPNCQRELFCNNGDIIEKAHIDPYCKTADNSFENLILLCPSCHTDFDKDNAFTPKEVLGWKRTRREELEKMFSKKYASFEELKKEVVPLLLENQTIFTSYYLKENKVLWDKLEAAILSNNRKISFRFLDETNLREIMIYDKKLIFVYEYCLSQSDIIRLSPEENTVIINLHNWNGNSCISKQAYEMAAAMKVELLTMKAFYGYINKFR